MCLLNDITNNAALMRLMRLLNIHFFPIYLKTCITPPTQFRNGKTRKCTTKLAHSSRMPHREYLYLSCFENDDTRRSRRDILALSLPSNFKGLCRQRIKNAKRGREYLPRCDVIVFRFTYKALLSSFAYCVFPFKV
jgi:hypothetical protein